MGFDSCILENDQSPIWLFQEGYDDFLATWKNPQTPASWIKNSCVWYSQVLVTHLGVESFQRYLEILNYGNRDASAELTHVWLSSSLKISPREQVIFMQKMLQAKLPISSHAIKMTKKIFFIEELDQGWKLFGKTGWSGSKKRPDGINELGWFVGWIEKENQFFLFAYNVRDKMLDLSKRIPRVKQLFFNGVEKF